MKLISIRLDKFLELSFLYCSVFTLSFVRCDDVLQRLPGGLVRMPILTHSGIHQRRLREGLESDQMTSNSNNRHLRKSDFFEGVTEVYQGYGAHFIDLWVGTPPQRQTVLVDTGSSTTAFPCNDCHDCGQGHHMDANFNTTDSESFRDLECNECLKGDCNAGNQCKMHLSYAEGSSWNAIEVSDLIHFGGFHNISKKNDHSDITVRRGDSGEYEFMGAVENTFRMKFGCQTDVDGLFKKQLADGILGMSNTKEAFWSQMMDQKMIASPMFSLCYVKHPIAHFDGSSAGSLIFGGTDKRLHSSRMVYAKFFENTKFYEVHIRKVYIHPGGGEALTGPKADIFLSRDETRLVSASEESLNQGGPIIDSGTTCVYMNEAIKGAFMAAWRDLMGFEFPTTPISIKGEELRNWPTIIIQLQGSSNLTGDEEFDVVHPKNVPNKAAILDSDHPDDILIALPPSHYMEYSFRNRTYFSRFEFTGDEENAAVGPVLGAAIMQGHDILFDIENKRVGIAESSCDYNYIISGKKSEEFDPFNVQGDIRKFYSQNFCKSRQCRSFVVVAFWLSHVCLLAMHIFLKRKNRICGQVHVYDSLKSKNSEEEVEAYGEGCCHHHHHQRS